MQNDLGGGDMSFHFNLTTYLNHLRGYRDFRPDTILFRTIRQERAALHYIDAH